MREDTGIALPEEDAALVPPPLLLLCWKHHAGSIGERIVRLKSRGPEGLAWLAARIPLLGASQMDLYTGALAPAAIAGEVRERLAERGLLAAERYRDWLVAHQGYRLLELSDGSQWVLRWGTLPGRYIHLHPGRYAPHTLRARAAPLKTAIAALGWAAIHGGNAFDPALVNRARHALLGLPPLLRLAPDDGVGRLISALQAKQPADP